MFKSSFDKNLESATSHLRLEPDWPSILLICDEINQKDVTPKNAFAAIKKKMNSPNPHSACYALMVLESIVKNCGAPVHEEVFTKENCEMFSTYLESTPHDNVRYKMLELVQTWAYAFRSSDKYQAIKDTVNILKAKGFTFPVLKEADAMFTADTAPNWADGRVCHRCRVEFTFTNRKHHCRNCGQVFCGQCTAKQCPLPKYGIEKDVRVCDGCYTSLQRPSLKVATRAANYESDLPAEYLNSSLAQQVQTPPRKSEQELKEEEELQLALALSQSEAELKKQEQQQKSYASAAYRMQQRSPSPEAPPVPKEMQQQEESNPDLAKYLNRGYWEQRKVSDSPMASPSAPSPMPTPQPQGIIELQPKTTDELQIDEFAANMRTQVEIFVNRMKSNSSRGRSISNDSSVQTLFMTLTSLHSQQLSYIKEMDDKRMWYEQLQDKLAQIKDSRAALDVLRQEHIEKMRRLAEEQERQRQIQMAQKLEIMRKKKQEYLQYQRQLALQRIQEQEREMQLRQEQQKAQYRMGQTAFPFMPPGAAVGGAPVGVHGSPSHHLSNVYNPYGYNPNSSGLVQPVPPVQPGQFAAAPQASIMSNAQVGGAGAIATTLPGMYTPQMPPVGTQTQPHNGGIMIQGQIPPGMLPPNSGGMLPGTLPTMNPDTSTQNPVQGPTQPVPQQHQQPQQQQQSQPQLTHVMLQQQQPPVMHNQPPIPTTAQMPPMVQQQQVHAPAEVGAAQMQAVAAAPTPPKQQPESPVAPEEPATAELISFD